MDLVSAVTKNAKLKLEVAYWKAKLTVEAQLGSISALPAVEEFIRLAPQDDRGAHCFTELRSSLLTR